MQDAPKTTLKDLSAAGNASQTGVNALLDATAHRKTTLRQRLADAMRTAAPAIGQYWEGQGGIYAGIMRDGDRQWHLILAPKEHGLIDTTWGEYPNEIPGEFSRRDGKHNTALILAAEPENEIAKFARDINIEGHSDYYWPAQCENNLLFANLPEQLNREWHWSSTQFSAHSAWGQHFGGGLQDVSNKTCSLAARAVRRILIIQ